MQHSAILPGTELVIVHYERGVSNIGQVKGNIKRQLLNTNHAMKALS